MSVLSDIQNLHKTAKLEFEKLKGIHENVNLLNGKLRDAQNDCLAAHKHQMVSTAYILGLVNSTKPASEFEADELQKIKNSLSNFQFELRDIRDNLPKNNGLYLRTVIGDINLSLATKQDRYAYKHDYERFKIFVSGVIAFFSFVLVMMTKSRIVDSLFHMILVWFYCTLTIREKILIINGSRIKGWWYSYHFIMTALSLIMLVWSNSSSYELFRLQFSRYVLYLQMVHCIQYYYQRGCLYKLRALGGGHAMDITVDGFMSWMLRRLTFVMPFLLIAYGFQFYNALTLYQIYTLPTCQQWEALFSAIIFGILATGNLATTGTVLVQKLLSRGSKEEQHKLSVKYSYPQQTEKIADGIRRISATKQ